MEGVKVIYDQSRNQIELAFDKKPSADVLRSLKEPGHRFTWSTQHKKWYGMRTPEREAFVKKYFGHPEPVRSQKVRERVPEKDYELGFGHLGNGVTVWNRKEEIGGDYKNVAHISEDGADISYYENLPGHVKESVQEMADKQRKAFLKKQAEELEAEAAHEVWMKERGVLPEGLNGVANVFASYYDSVGDSRIYPEASIDLVDFRNTFCDGYFADRKMFVAQRVREESFALTDLEGAMQPGAVCKKYALSFAEPCKETVFDYLFNELGLRTVGDLIGAVTEGKALGALQVGISEEKGMEVFSPFAEVTPLKEIPEKWTKTHFIRALCSGQIYEGAQNYQFSDDYVVDSANGFGKGKKLSLAMSAKEAVENWRDGKMLRMEEQDGDRASISLRALKESQTFLFDLTCDLEKGKQWAEQKQNAIAQSNAELLKGVLDFSEVSIEPSRFYHVAYLVKNEHTGEYETKRELVQGRQLVDSENHTFHWWYENVTSLEELQILPNRMYQISDIFHPYPGNILDPRFLVMGNQEILVSGKALQELSEEKFLFYHLSERTSCGKTPSFERVKSELQAFLDGRTFWMTGSEVDYADSLQRACNEEARLFTPKKEVQEHGDSEKEVSLPEEERSSFGTMEESKCSVTKESLFARIERIEAEQKAKRGRVGVSVPTKGSEYHR